MIKVVRRGESTLQYRVLDGGLSRSRPRHRVAALCLAGLLLSCLAIAAAVILPILLSTSLVALPAKLAVTHRGLQGSTQYFAILPVREAKYKEIRLIAEARAAKSTRASLIYDWIIENRYAICAACVILLMLQVVFFIVIRRKYRNRSHQDRTWEYHGALLSDHEED